MLHRSLRVGALAACAFIMLMQPGCDHEAVNGNTAGLDEYLDSLDIPSVVPAGAADPIPIPGTPVETYNCGGDTCERRSWRGTVSLSEIVLYSPLTDVAYPCALATGRSTRSSGVPTPIGLRRGPCTITITDIGSAPPGTPDPTLSRRIDNPTVSSVEAALNELRNRYVPVSTPAALTEYIRTYSSLEEGMFRLGLSGKYLSASLRSVLERSSYSAQTNIVVQFSQRYYCATMNTPRKPASVFHPDVTVEGLVAATQSDPLSPAYVNQVCYGRLLVMSVSSSASESALRAAISASIRFLKGGASADFTAEERGVLQGAEFRVAALGGGASAVLTLLGTPTGLDSLRAYYQAGINYGPSSPGIALSYSMRWLSTNDEARLSFTTDFPIETRHPQQFLRTVEGTGTSQDQFGATCRAGVSPCSPDGKWRAFLNTLTVGTAAAGEELRNWGVECYGYGCGWTQQQSVALSDDRRVVTAKLLSWGSVVTWRLTAQVYTRPPGTLRK